MRRSVFALTGIVAAGVCAASVHAGAAGARAHEAPLDATLVIQEYSRDLLTKPGVLDEELARLARLFQPSDRVDVIFAGEDQRAWPLGTESPERTAAASSETCRPIYDALARVLMRPADPARRRVVIVLSVGEGSGSVLAVTPVEDIAKRAGARVYVMTKEPFVQSWRNTRTSGTACARLELDWSEPRQSVLRGIAGRREVDGGERQRWMEGKRRLAALAQLTGGKEIRPPLFGRSAEGPVREAIADARR